MPEPDDDIEPVPIQCPRCSVWLWPNSIAISERNRWAHPEPGMPAAAALRAPLAVEWHLRGGFPPPS
jgi:hypothetical protein